MRNMYADRTTDEVLNRFYIESKFCCYIDPLLHSHLTISDSEWNSIASLLVVRIETNIYLHTEMQQTTDDV